jgi:hypothetical protein
MSVTHERPATRAPEDPDDRLPSHEEVYALVAAACAMLAGAIHLAVVPEHWDVARPMGVFFLAVGLAQLCLGGALGWRLRPVVLVMVIVANTAVMGLYVASRTVDLPFVPPHGADHSVSHLPVAGGRGNGVPVYPGSRIEPVGVVDLVCLVAELVLVVMLAGLLPRRWRNAVTSLMVLAGVLAAVLRGAGLLL